MTVETANLTEEDFAAGDAVVDQIMEEQDKCPEDNDKESADDEKLYSGLSWNDLVSFLEIDELKLDEALKDQAVVFQIVTEQAVKANRTLNVLKYEKEQLKLRTETLTAATSLHTRSSAETSGAKMTEGKVDETVKAHPHVVAIKEQLLAADYEISEAFTDLLRWESLRKSYEERSLSLRGMVSLINSGYAAYSKS